jgi:hypothetical protein
VIRRAVVALALLALIAPAVAPAVARADGDPASDVLLTQDSFLPYAPPVRDDLKTALEDLLEQTREAGFPLKVALVNSDQDLGAYPQLFNQPQEYANLLTRELQALNPHGDPLKAVHLLIVMPGGFGGNNLGDDVDDALAPVAIQGEAQSDGLAKAALEAVARLATANGFPTETPPEADIRLTAQSADRGGGGTPVWVFALPAVLLFAGLFVAGRIQRRRAESISD